MRRVGAIPPIALLLAAIISTNEARSQLTFCNGTLGDISSAVAFGQPGTSMWTSKGWFRFAPGECGIVVPGELTHRYYYTLAHDNTTHFEWKGDIGLCTSANAFAIPFCDTNCATRGFDVSPFSRLDVGSRASHTVQFTCEYCAYRTSSGLRISLPDVRVPVPVGGSTFDATLSGSVLLQLSADRLSASLSIDADLADLQSVIPSLVQSTANRSDSCDQVITLHTVNLSPSDATARLYVGGHFEQWACPWTEVLGIRIDGGSHRLFEQNGDVTLWLTPYVSANTVTLTVQLGNLNADGLLGGLLGSEWLSPWIYQTVRDALPRAINVGNFQQMLPTTLRQFQPSLSAVRFFSTPRNTLGLHVDASFSVLGEQASALMRSFEP
jgi:uncharacterized membrane protein